MPLLSTPDIAEFTRLAGLDLTATQTADLGEMLHLQETGKWRWPEWRITNPQQSTNLVVARALIGFLLLDENVLWTAQTRPVLRDAFRRLETSAAHFSSEVALKIRRANGEESIERLDTHKRIQFACTRYSGSARGCTCDLLIISDGSKHADQVRIDLVPTMAARPNPQIIYA